MPQYLRLCVLDPSLHSHSHGFFEPTSRPTLVPPARHACTSRTTRKLHSQYNTAFLPTLAPLVLDCALRPPRTGPSARPLHLHYALVCQDCAGFRSPALLNDLTPPKSLPTPTPRSFISEPITPVRPSAFCQHGKLDVYSHGHRNTPPLAWAHRDTPQKVPRNSLPKRTYVSPV